MKLPAIPLQSLASALLVALGAALLAGIYPAWRLEVTEALRSV